MERIKTLLDKIAALNNKPNIEAIDVDLMADYVKVLYADLLEWRERLVFTKGLSTETSLQKEESTKPVETVNVSSSIKEEPSLEEMTQALEKELTEEDAEPDLDPTPLPEASVNKVSLTAPDSSPPVSIHIFDKKEESQKTPEKLTNIDTQSIPFPQKKEDVRKFIGINEKFVFINELFDGNRDAYEEVLNEIIEFSNTEDAIEWLNKTVAKPFDWKEDDFNVQDFYRVLESYYKRRKN